MLGLGGDPTLMQLDDAPRVVQPDAGAAAVLEGRVVEAREAPEQLVLLRLAEARPLIAHFDPELGRAPAARRGDLDGEPDLAAVDAVLDGVVEQIDEDDAQQRRVAAHQGRAGHRHLGEQLHAARVQLRPHELERLLDDLRRHVHARAALELELAALDARQIKVLVDEAEEILALARDAGELALLDLGELAEVALFEQLRVGDHRGDRALELVADEAEHLRVGVVGLLELLDAPRLLDGLAEALRDRHLQLDVPRPVGVRAPRAAEDEADHAALHAQRAGEVGAHALLHQALCGAAARVRLEVQVEVADDARLATVQHLVQRGLLERLRVVLVDGQRRVGGAVVVARDALAALVHEGEPDTVARDERLGVVEEVVHDGAQRGPCRDLLVDGAQDLALVRRDRREHARVVERVDETGGRRRRLVDVLAHGLAQVVTW